MLKDTILSKPPGSMGIFFLQGRNMHYIMIHYKESLKIVVNNNALKAKYIKLISGNH